MPLSNRASDLLMGYFEGVGDSHSVSSSQIAAGFNPDGVRYPEVFEMGFASISEQLNDESQALSLINVVMVDDRQGSGFLDALGAPCTSRTDVNKNDRDTSSLISNPSDYTLKETQCDVHLPFVVVNKWALASANSKHHKKLQQDFQTKYMKFVFGRMCLDVLNIGFNGTGAEDETTPSDKLTDVNKGWIQVVKEQLPEQVIPSAVIDPTGAEPDSYRNLDGLISDLVEYSISSEDRFGAVCVISDNLVAQEKQQVYSSSDYHHEKKNTSDTFSRFGGLDRVVIPNFPDDKVVVTSLSNLSVYIKGDTTFRSITTNHKRNRVEDYQHREEAYIVENLKAFAAVESVSYAVPEGAEEGLGE